MPDVAKVYKRTLCNSPAVEIPGQTNFPKPESPLFEVHLRITHFPTGPGHQTAFPSPIRWRVTEVHMAPYDPDQIVGLFTASEIGYFRDEKG